MGVDIGPSYWFNLQNHQCIYHISGLMEQVWLNKIPSVREFDFIHRPATIFSIFTTLCSPVISTICICHIGGGRQGMSYLLIINRWRWRRVKMVWKHQGTTSLCYFKWEAGLIVIGKFLFFILKKCFLSEVCGSTMWKSLLSGVSSEKNRWLTTLLSKLPPCKVSYDT